MKKLLAILLVLLLTVTCVSCAKQPAADSSAAAVPATEPASESETPKIHTSGHYEYIIHDDGTAGIVRFTDFYYEGDLVIPDTLDGIRVTAIEDYAFGYNSSLPGVTNPDLFNLGSSVSLVNIEPDPDQVIQIDPSQININPELIGSLGDVTEVVTTTDPDLYILTPPEIVQPFSGITGITVPEGVTLIGQCAFSNCSSLSRIALPESLTDLGNCALSWCDLLTEITIPNSVIRIGVNPFYMCAGLDHIILSPDHPYLELRDGLLFSKADKRLVCCLVGSASGDLTIPEGTEIIGSGIFNKDSITTLTIPDGVKQINDNAFQSCASLSRVVLPESLTSIGAQAFMGCESLTEITIPDSVASIGNNPFCMCSNLERIVLSPDHPYLELQNGMLFSKADKRLVCCPNGALSENLIIPDGTKVIGDFAFVSGEGVTSVTLPDSLVRIEDHVFQEFSSLTAVTFPGNLNEIGDYAFSFTGLMEIDIPGSVKKVGVFAFGGCESLTRVHIMDGVNEIGEGAFYDDHSLEEITVPSSVTVIGEMAFDTMSNTSVIVVPGSYAEQYCKDNSIPYVLN